MDIVEALNLIDQSLEKISYSSYWSRYLPALSAIVAALTAVLATKSSVWFSSRRIEINCARALFVEIRQIVESIDSSVADYSQNNYVKVSFLLNPDRICPVYRGASVSIGLLNSSAIHSIVDFYTSVLTVKPISVKNPDEMGLLFLKDTLSSISNKGTIAFKCIESEIL